MLFRSVGSSARSTRADSYARHLWKRQGYPHYQRLAHHRRTLRDGAPKKKAQSDGDRVNLAPFQLGQKNSRIHDNAGDVTATRFLCTNRNTHCETTRAVQVANEVPGQTRRPQIRSRTKNFGRAIASNRPRPKAKEFVKKGSAVYAKA